MSKIEAPPLIDPRKIDVDSFELTEVCEFFLRFDLCGDTVCTQCMFNNVDNYHKWREENE